MSERVRETLFASLFASKRFVVAACAAIAMVLGAMSAGASMSVGVESAASNTMPFSVAGSISKAVIVTKNSAFTQQRTMGGSSVLVANPHYVTTQISSKSDDKRSSHLNFQAATTTNVSVFQDKTPILEQLQPKPSGDSGSTPSAPSASEPAGAQPSDTTSEPSPSQGTPTQEETQPTPPEQSTPEPEGDTASFSAESSSTATTQ